MSPDKSKVAVCALWVRNVEAEHGAHQAHLLEENGGKLPEPPAYEYLNRRRKSSFLAACMPVLIFIADGGPFPWGVNTLFFNPKVRLHTKLEASY